MMETKTPKIRFKGFSEPWKTKKLGDICTKIGSGKTPRGGDSVYTKEGMPFIRSQNVLDSRLFLDGVCITLETHEEMSGSKVLAHDVLLNITGGSIGRSCVVPESFLEGNVNQHVCIIRTKQDSPFFLQAHLSSHRGQKLVFQGQTGSGREGLNFETIRGFKINFPSLPEQQKIASFLSSVDERIELLERKKEKLEAYKKGVMQQIFPSTGSGQAPQIRFKQDDGSDFPDWEEKRFSDLYDFKSTNSFSRELLNHENGSYLNIHYGDIHTKFNTLLDASAPNLPFVNDDVEIRKQMRENTVSLGDLIIADASEDYKDIGKAVEVSNIGETPVLAGLHTIHAALKNSALEIGFGGYMLKSEGIRKQIMRIAQGTKVLSISATRVGELALSVPCKEEQRKIVAFLRSLDQSINNIDSQTQGLRTWKKGLLQQMFV